MKWRVTTSMSNGEAGEVGLSPILAYGLETDCGVVYFLPKASPPREEWETTTQGSPLSDLGARVVGPRTQKET